MKLFVLENLKILAVAMVIFFFLNFLAAQCSMLDLNSPTRDRTHTPCIERAES